MIDNAVRAIVISKNVNGEKEEFEKWQNRVKSYKEWKDKHKLKDCKPGDKIDVRDTEFIWCVG
jgi:hypothetical protein